MRLKLWQGVILTGICVGVLLYCGINQNQGATALTNNDFLRFHVVANSDSEEDQALKLKVRDGLLEEINQSLAKEVMANYAFSADGDGEAAVETSLGTVSSKVIKTSPDGDVVANGASSSTTENTPNIKTVKLELEDAEEYVVNHLEDLEKIAEEIIRQNGYDYSVKAEIGSRWIPEKTYGNVVFPAGNYQALTMIIGEGKGENWWCVLFPPLCLIGLQPPEDEIFSADQLDEKYKPLIKQDKKTTTLQIKFKTLELINKE